VNIQREPDRVKVKTSDINDLDAVFSGYSGERSGEFRTVFESVIAVSVRAPL
jgi:hypothetical protein